MNDFHPRHSVTQMLHSLQWQPLHERRAHLKVIMVYKIIHGYIAIPPEPPYLFPTTRTTRRQSQYQQQRCRTTCFMNSFFPSATCLWSQLPVSVTATPTLDQFRSQTGRGDSPPTHYVAVQQDCFLLAPVCTFWCLFVLDRPHIRSFAPGNSAPHNSTIILFIRGMYCHWKKKKSA